MSVPHSSEQNGVAERMNRNLMESARSTLSHAGLSNRYWAEAAATAAYIRNRTPTAAIKEEQTPYERWYGKRPNISHLKVFGCMAFAHIPDAQRQKLDKNPKNSGLLGTVYEPKGTGCLTRNLRRWS